jgi:hypothetical protein
VPEDGQTAQRDAYSVRFAHPSHGIGDPSAEVRGPRDLGPGRWLGSDPEGREDSRGAAVTEKKDRTADDAAFLRDTLEQTRAIRKMCVAEASKLFAELTGDHDVERYEYRTLAEAAHDDSGRLRAHALDMSEVEEKIEALQGETAIVKECVEFFGCLAPVLTMELLRKKGGDPTAKLVVQARLMGDFAKTFTPEQTAKLFDMLDGVQRDILGELLSGALPPELAPPKVGQLMASLRPEQVETLRSVCTTDTQKEGFRRLFGPGAEVGRPLYLLRGGADPR